MMAQHGAGNDTNGGHNELPTYHQGAVHQRILWPASNGFSHEKTALGSCSQRRKGQFPNHTING